MNLLRTAVTIAASCWSVGQGTGVKTTSCRPIAFVFKLKTPSETMVWKPDMEAAMACEETVFNFELFREKPKRFYLSGMATKLFAEDKDGNSRVEGRLWILTDVTVQRLEERMARNFLSLISHKFKTPLASINGFAQILKDESQAKNLPDLVKKSSETIFNQGQKLNGLVEGLLDFVTIDTLDASSLDKIDFDAAELIGEIVEDMRNRFKGGRQA